MHPTYDNTFLCTKYKSFVLPNFSYCSTIWHDGNNSRMDKLHKMQKRAARVITGSQYDVSSTEIFNNLNWDPINRPLDRRELIMIMYKISNGLATNYLTKLFNVCNNQNLNLRSNNIKLALAEPNTNFIKRRFSF